jgi:hypothetical protein
MNEKTGRQNSKARTPSESQWGSELAGLRLTIEQQHRRFAELGKIISASRNGSHRPRIVTDTIVPPGTDTKSSRKLQREESPYPWWPVPVFPERQLVAAAGFACATLDEQDLPTIAISVFGREGIDLRSTVSLVAGRQSQGRDFLPLFLTDAPYFDPIQEHGFTVTCFPRRYYPHPDDALLSAKYDFISRKWGVVSFLDLGKEAATRSTPEAILEAISPLNETTVIAVPNTTSGLRVGAIGGRQPITRLRGEASLLRRSTSEQAEVEERMIRESGIFDENWYRAQNPDVDRRGIDAVRHFLTEGAIRGRDPSPLFHTVFYARQMLASRREDVGG